MALLGRDLRHGLARARAMHQRVAHSSSKLLETLLVPRLATEQRLVHMVCSQSMLWHGSLIGNGALGVRLSLCQAPVRVRGAEAGIRGPFVGCFPPLHMRTHAATVCCKPLRSYSPETAWMWICDVISGALTAIKARLFIPPRKVWQPVMKGYALKCHTNRALQHQLLLL